MRPFVWIGLFSAKITSTETLKRIKGQVRGRHQMIDDNSWINWTNEDYGQMNE